MKKKHLPLSKKLILHKDIVSDLSRVTGGAPPTVVGCGTPTTADCPIQTGNCETISICNDQCAVTWGCPPPHTQVFENSVCVACNATFPGQKGC